LVEDKKTQEKGIGFLKNICTLKEELSLPHQPSRQSVPSAAAAESKRARQAFTCRLSLLITHF
jgi:hypothetical protein